MKLIALGVAAEVVVIFDDQDARLGSRNLAKEMRRGEPADAAPHHHQIVGFSSVNRGPGLGPEGAVTQAVRHFE